MSTKFFLRVLIVCCLVVVVFLAVEVIYQSNASASVAKTVETDPRLAGSDWIERHPSTALHNADTYVNSDWIERHPSTYYAGSDWIERHPGSGQP